MKKLSKKEIIENEINYDESEIKRLKNRIKLFKSLLKNLDKVSIDDGYICVKG